MNNFEGRKSNDPISDNVNPKGVLEIFFREVPSSLNISVGVPLASDATKYVTFCVETANI